MNQARTIILRSDRRRFAGSETEIVETMRLFSFGWDDKPLRDYIDYIMKQIVLDSRTDISRADYAKIDDAALCQIIVDKMVASGLALEIF